MKIYTKILIGMVVGAMVGLFVGPRSSFLEHDLYKVKDGSSIELRLSADDPGSKLELPKDVPLALAAKETLYEQVKDSDGAVHKVPHRVRVEFTYHRQLVLRDRDGKLKRQVAAAYDNPEPGTRLQAWLILKHKPLRGDVLVTPEPVSSLGDTVVTYISPVGELFMRLIRMVIVPLVFASLLVGVAGLGDVRKLGRLGGRTLLLYLMTTATAVSIGLLCAHAIQPGKYVASKDKERLVEQFKSGADETAQEASKAPSTVENILNIIPKNPISSLNNGNMLQIIFFAVIFGIALTLLKQERAKEVINFFDTVQHAMIIVIHMVMAVAPYGVAALLAEVVGNSGASILKALLVYSLTVVLGLAVLAGGVYAGLVRVLAKVRWVPFMKAARPAQMVAFSTSSSSATLPITLECAQQNLGISNSVSSFVVPLGSTVNMDGTALYQGVAAIFIAQVFGVDLSFGDQVGMVLAATLASVGAAGVPGAGMITLAMVLIAAGIPEVGVALILGVDRILDMFRSAVNVTGDLAVTAVMATAEGETVRVLSPGEDAGHPERGFEDRLDVDEHSVEADAAKDGGSHSDS